MIIEKDIQDLTTTGLKTMVMDVLMITENGMKTEVEIVTEAEIVDMDRENTGNQDALKMGKIKVNVVPLSTSE